MQRHTECPAKSEARRHSRAASQEDTKRASPNSAPGWDMSGGCRTFVKSHRVYGSSVLKKAPRRSLLSADLPSRVRRMLPLSHKLSARGCGVRFSGLKIFSIYGGSA